MMKRTLLLSAVAALLATGCGGEGLIDESVKPEITDLDTEIVNGTVDNGHPTVGKVRDNGDDICTGTLIGQKTVLCAAHCIESLTASRYGFVLNGTVYPAAAVYVHPGWNGDADNYEGVDDISVIILKNAPSVTPSAVATAAPFVGQALTLVGYGVTGENKNNYGTKRITTNNISKVSATKIYWLPRNGVGTTCYGDSGGPAFATVNGQEVQVGITSGGEAPCETGYSWDTRVDAYLSWIKQVANNDVKTAGTCTPSCSNKQCGDDGCGGSCGSCGSGTTCSADFQCVASGGTGGVTNESISGSVKASGVAYYGPFTVAAGSAFSVQMTGTGDPDLYVRFGAKPTTSTYDCRPYVDGATENCKVNVPSGKTTAYIMVRGYTAATFKLAISFVKPTAAGTGSAMTAAVDGTVEANKDVNYAPLAVRAGTTFKVVMTGSGDPDLYVNFGSAPTATAFACRPYLDGAAETCTVTVPAGQSNAYVMVHGYSASTYHLDISYTAP